MASFLSPSGPGRLDPFAVFDDDDDPPVRAPVRGPTWTVTAMSPNSLGQTLEMPSETTKEELYTMVLGNRDDPRWLYYLDEDGDRVLIKKETDVIDWLELSGRNPRNTSRARKKAKLFVLDEHAAGTPLSASAVARPAWPAWGTAEPAAAAAAVVAPAAAAASGVSSTSPAAGGAAVAGAAATPAPAVATVASAGAAPPAAAAAAAAAAVTGAGSAAAAPAFGPGQGHRIRLLGLFPRGTPLVPGGLNGQLSLSELKDQIYQALLNGELSVDYFQDRAGHVAADGTIVLGKGGIVAAWSAPALRSKLISLIQFVEAARSNPSVRPQ